MVRENKVRRALKADRPALGTFVKIHDPSVVEIMGLAGFDFFILDTEHSALNRESMVDLIRAADLTGMTPIVRVRENRPVEILQVLDSGALGVLVPQVNDAAEARRAVEGAKYAPLGTRGFAPTQRGAGYGFMPLDDYIATANDSILTACYCETKSAVEHLDQILEIPELDVVFIGPMDLSQSYGMTGRVADPFLTGIMKDVVRKTRAAGKAAGTIAADAGEAAALIKAGYRFVTIGADQSALVSFARKAVSDFRALAGRA